MDSLTHKESTSNKECIRKLFTELKSFLIRKFHEFSKEHWIYLPGSLQILVSSFLVFGDLGCVIFFTMISVCKARQPRLLKNANKHFRNFIGQIQRKTNYRGSQAYAHFGTLKKTVLHEIRVSGTVLWSPTNANSPTYAYISKKPW